MVKVAIIGGGLAGCAIAHFCIRNGLYPIIFERSNALASAASGNGLGIVSPRISAEMTPYAFYYSQGFQKLVGFFDDVKAGGADIGWHQCGTLHLSLDTRKEKQFSKTVQNWAWDEKDMHILSKGDVSEQAGIDLDYEALFLPQSGYVSPPKLCAFYTEGVEVRYGENVTDEMLSDIDADIIVLACATGLPRFELDVIFLSVRCAGKSQKSRPVRPARI
jgi:tRNA 5-methylaminomethyl-2-thiouridine biosynthesis bifunctional protein